MKQRGFSNLPIVAGIAIVVVMAGYFVLRQNTTFSPIQIPDTNLPTNTTILPTIPKTPEVNPSPTRSVSEIFESRKQFLNTAIVIEDVVVFDYRCTDSEGGGTCSTNVLIGSLNDYQFHLRENGKYISCPGTVVICQGWEKEKKYEVTGVLGVPRGSEDFDTSYYIDVKSKEVVAQKKF